MEEGLEKRQLKIFCPQHQAVFEVQENAKIVCEIREHALSNNFPKEEFWEYCCDCQTFFPSQLEVGGKAKAACPQCERPTTSRFVCGECKVVAFDSGEDTKGKQFHLDQEGFAVEPSCPGCLTEFTGEKLHLHKCAEIDAVFATPREICPFCKKETVKPKPKTKVKAPPVVKCPKCQTNNEADSFFCNNCGEELRSNPQLVKRGTATAKTQLLGNLCPNCGASNQIGSPFCVGCGQALKVEENKPKADTSLPPPIPQTAAATQAWSGAGASTAVNPSAVKPGNGKGCLIAVGVVIGLIFLCVALQGIMSNKNRSDSSYTATPSPTAFYSTPSYTPPPSKSSSNVTFNHTYSGSIGGKSFSMRLERNGSSLKGTASTSRHTDRVEGEIDSSGSFSLDGYEDGSRLTGRYKGQINSDGSVSGTWTNLQGAQGTSFYLSEQ